MKKRTVCLVMIVLILLSVGSCNRKKEPEQYSTSSFAYFDTVTVITGVAESREAFDAVSNEIMRELGEYHRLYTIYEQFEGLNNLCTVNEVRDGTHLEVEVDERILDLLDFCKEVYLKTNGKTNVAMGSVLSIWHEYRERGLDDPQNATLPSAPELEEAAGHTDINDIIIDREKKTVFLRDPELTLDVGAVAKGYAVERIAQKLEERGITGYCLNVGGNVRTLGVRGDGSKWRVGIENPLLGDDAYLAVLGLSDRSLVVSGSYQRYYTVDGKQYHHIIDPDTLQPAAYYVSVAIVCPSSAMGDALSTALFCIQYEEAAALIASMPDTEALFVFADGTRRETAGFEAFKSDKR